MHYVKSYYLKSNNLNTEEQKKVQKTAWPMDNHAVSTLPLPFGNNRQNRKKIIYSGLLRTIDNLSTAGRFFSLAIYFRAAYCRAKNENEDLKFSISLNLKKTNTTRVTKK